MKKRLLPLLIAVVVLISSGSSWALNVGDPAPGWTLQDTEGNTHSLSDYQGKVVFLFFMGAT